MDYINKISNANNLIQAFHRCEKSSGWKCTTQQYRCNLLTETHKLRNELRNGKYNQSRGTQFNLMERGHLRLIKALCVRDMVAQHSICDNALNPLLMPHLIHDNGASVKGKGISFTRKRFEQHLRSFYRKHGKSGYILKIDFQKFFDNIEHEKLVEQMERYIADGRLLNMIRSILQSYKVDVSYSDDADIIDKVFNSIEYENISKNLLTGERFMMKSMGIGSPISQPAGVFFPTPIDTYCKTVLGLKYYDVYMDDRIMIHNSKEYLKSVLMDIRRIANELGLHINERKTQIIKLSHSFTFLKTQYILTDSGHIVKKIPKSVIVCQRRKMKKLAIFVASGDMTVKKFNEQYQSWRGDKRRYNAHQTLLSMDGLHRRLLRWIRQKQSEKNNRKSVI